MDRDILCKGGVTIFLVVFGELIIRTVYYNI